jgi:hypothetical protein
MVFQVLTAWAALLNTWTIPHGSALIAGVGDCQIALGMTLVCIRDLRWSTRIPICGMLLIAGCATQYVARVQTQYPMVFAEEYLVPVFVGGSILAALFWLRRHRGLSLTISKPGSVASTCSSNQWTISDLLLWMLGCAVILVIGKRSMTLTNVSGMSDPWETISFAAFGIPSGFLLVRLPLLLLYLLVNAALWTAIAMSILREERLTVRSLSFSLSLCVALSIAEIILSSTCLLFDPPWVWLPVSVNPAINFCQRLSVHFEGRHDFSEILWHDVNGMLVVLATRAAVFLPSLMLLRGAGCRFTPITDLCKTKEPSYR